MEWWNFNDSTFVTVFIILVLATICLLFFVITFLTSEHTHRRYLTEINNDSNTTRIYIINVKQNNVYYFNRSDLRKKRTMDLASFYDKFHPNDVDKVKNWIFSICVDAKNASPYLEADIFIKGRKTYYSLLKLMKYDSEVGLVHIESHLMKYITPTNYVSKKKRGMVTGIVKRSVIDQIISHSRSLRGFTFGIRFFYIRQKVLSNDKIERYMVTTLKNEIYPFASNPKIPRQILDVADNEMILFDLRLSNRDEAMKLALSLEHSLKKCIGVNGFSESVNFSISIVENVLYYQDFDMLISKARETCMTAQQSGQTIMVYKKTASQMLELDKYNQEVEKLLSRNLLRYLFRPIVDAPRKRTLGYFSYIKGYDTPFASYSEMSKYAAMTGKNRELFAMVAKFIIPKFDSEKPSESSRLFFNASLFDIDHTVDVLSQIPSVQKIRLVLVFDEQEVNENSNQLEVLDQVMKQLREMHIELALSMKDRNLLLKPAFYSNFDFFIAGAAMMGEIKKNNRIRLSIHTLIEQLLSYKRPIIATDLEGWQAIELVIKSGITIVSSDVISPSNDMLLPVEKKKMEKLVAMDDSFH